MQLAANHRVHAVKWRGTADPRSLNMLALTEPLRGRTEAGQFNKLSHLLNWTD